MRPPRTTAQGRPFYNALTAFDADSEPSLAGWINPKRLRGLMIFWAYLEPGDIIRHTAKVRNDRDEFDGESRSAA